MYTMVRLILGLLIWGGIVALQVVLMAIGRFFARASQQRTGHRLYLIPILFTAIGAGYYLSRLGVPTRHPDFAGIPLLDILFLVSGTLLIVLGNLLYDKMIGERRGE